MKTICIILLPLLLVSCSFSTGSTSPSANFEFSDSSITVDGVTMRYTLALHKSYSVDQPPVAVILALHYGGKTTQSSGKDFLETLILPAYKQVRAAIIAPVVLESGAWDNEISEKCLLAMIEKVQSLYSTNTSRILVTGYSLGGIGTWYLAARNPDIFTAAIPVSASIPESVQPIRTLPPAYVIHSRQDEVFPYARTQSQVNTLIQNGLTVEFSTVEDLTHYQTAEFVTAFEETINWLLEIW